MLFVLLTRLNVRADYIKHINLKRAVESTKQALAGIPAAAIDAP